MDVMANVTSENYRDAVLAFQNSINDLVGQVHMHPGLPKQLFAICSSSSDIKERLSDCVVDEAYRIKDAFADVQAESNDFLHKFDFGEITEGELRELHQQNAQAESDVFAYEADVGRVIAELEREMPGMLDEQAVSAFVSMGGGEQSFYNEVTFNTMSHALYSSENYFRLADNAERLTQATWRVRDCERTLENLSSDHYGLMQELDDARMQQNACAHAMAYTWYGMEAFEQYRDDEIVTPFSYDVITEKENEIMDIAQHDGYKGLMAHIDEHMFYQMSLSEQLSVVSERFERNEAINSDLIDYCVNQSMVKFSERQQGPSSTYGDMCRATEFEEGIEALIAFKNAYPQANLVSEDMITTMETALYTDGRSVDEETRLAANQELVSTDGFPDYPFLESDSDFDNPDV